MTQWNIDAGHSQIGFKVKHLGIANVSGYFRKFSGTVQTGNDDFENAGVTFTLEVASIDTNNTERDAHLSSSLFFDAARFPTIHFTGLLADDTLKGELTILNNTRPVSLQVEHTGSGIGRFNDHRAGFELSGKINRKDFGLNFHLLNEAGNLIVGDEVKLSGEIELIRL
ncbi:YceI family protein [Chitinophaga sancti]|uniref:Polyisoprenoid-binding protein YceI n=1 Tax=Chitinophaga sancti TaxID=1004 RepID=A0A1K1SN06_9BACT|nr:YceI family protein [Chitinophaga sancti]WQD60078.1 YceI family protein [Chitinophaga sancti]WQG87794.1 YceI family protein [Chitinophaga sancti]SFW85707.1 Polyisoprenoid-binding protein YceI [Chitinophaga sancti]